MKILFHISSLFGGGAERVMSYLIKCVDAKWREK